ncbi:flavin reductase family protein [Niveibacterium umoris]|uniref:3-hydroxy-9,10-secoandrosta-1,3,5(10)-triene-9, 17-dione monooxygenase reductase component n=1 Tax=Niveibacterium umoris TaxID=1193620 RepID=A0A840BJQ4_9RHOO|nr:flavin reductase family protein [Niveibacterium umoris]MBB4013771.1 3-hydroxy-9,10-secoandrosta-1,3,5(10)-triene-9,17-dione monooxygenase reductase component [Niveibacterium umoris]
MPDPDDQPEFDTLAFRRALGEFATGITVVTARTPEGRRVGLTVNSFNSVSLSPPLVLWSLARHLPVMDDFLRCSHYAINVLASHQHPLSQRFATRSEDKFVDLDVGEGIGGAPLLHGCCAWFECRNGIRHDGGDHVIFIGEVERFERGGGEPLIYHAGRYRYLSVD